MGPCKECGQLLPQHADDCQTGKAFDAVAQVLSMSLLRGAGVSSKDVDDIRNDIAGLAAQLDRRMDEYDRHAEAILWRITGLSQDVSNLTAYLKHFRGMPEDPDEVVDIKTNACRGCGEKFYLPPGRRRSHPDLCSFCQTLANPKGETRRRVEEIIAILDGASVPLNAAQVAGAMHWSPAQTGQLLLKLANKGIVRKVSRAVYAAGMSPADWKRHVAVLQAGEALASRVLPPQATLNRPF